MGSEIFRELEPTKLLFRCAVPAAITSVFGALYSIADGFFVGRFIGEDALAAVNLIMPIVMIAEALSNMVATGASVNISMLLGAGKREEASRVFSFAVAFIIVSSCILGALGLAFARPFVELVAPGATLEAIGYGVEYLSVHSALAPLVLILDAARYQPLLRSRPHRQDEGPLQARCRRVGHHLRSSVRAYAARRTFPGCAVCEAR